MDVQLNAGQRTVIMLVHLSKGQRFCVSFELVVIHSIQYQLNVCSCSLGKVNIY